MNTSTLQEEAQREFNTLQEEKTQHEKRIAEINEELLRLQGEWRAYQKLDKPEPNEANTIVVEPKKGKKNG